MNAPPTRPSRLIRDPRAIPVLSTDAHLPAIDPARLQPALLRQRLAGAHERVAPIAGDGNRHDLHFDREPTPAAVLVPLVPRPHGLSVLLTERTAHLHDHAGQVSFPGGRTDPEDADAVATALREAHEEVGLGAERIEVIARLPTYTTVTRYVVTPVVGLVDPDHQLALDAFEVAEAFEVPLAFLMNPAHHRRHRFEAAPGVWREFLSMPWSPDPAGQPDRFFIWGATAAMLRNLYHLLADD
ncbi:CoA pyrophosphatase [Ideonella sp. 4Y16]|uniref:CoA pyrophosphatase n=1 Tax=Ideonella alba TaxID=2824118 RepID=A0A940YGC6_9BURK|nr:CoA pyrophosphatase [Ideonella alba]MBQ0932816.1 CoA pyrophosphatase [Ideonella alba]MBQ0945968.1 CoA pyrophosphatase [Ideonella alba]